MRTQEKWGGGGERKGCLTMTDGQMAQRSHTQTSQATEQSSLRLLVYMYRCMLCSRRASSVTLQLAMSSVGEPEPDDDGKDGDGAETEDEGEEENSFKSSFPTSGSKRR